MKRIMITHEMTGAKVDKIHDRLLKEFKLKTRKQYKAEQIAKMMEKRAKGIQNFKTQTAILLTPKGVAPAGKNAEVMKGEHSVIYSGFDISKQFDLKGNVAVLKSKTRAEQEMYAEIQVNLDKIFGKIGEEQVDNSVIYLLADDEAGEEIGLFTPTGIKKFISKETGKDVSRVPMDKLTAFLEKNGYAIWREVKPVAEIKRDTLIFGMAGNKNAKYYDYVELITKYLEARGLKLIKNGDFDGMDPVTLVEIGYANPDIFGDISDKLALDGTFFIYDKDLSGTLCSDEDELEETYQTEAYTWALSR